jgi:hypothetical protein
VVVELWKFQLGLAVSQVEGKVRVANRKLLEIF